MSSIKFTFTPILELFVLEMPVTTKMRSLTIAVRVKRTSKSMEVDSSLLRVSTYPELMIYPLTVTATDPSPYTYIKELLGTAVNAHGGI